MQKLTNMEAQRVINCVEDALSRINTLSYVSVGNPDPQLLAALELECGAVKDALATEWAKEDEYLVARARAAAQANHGRRHGHNHGHHQVPAVSGEIVGALHEAVRTVCRQLRRDPLAMEKVAGASQDMNPAEHDHNVGGEFQLFHDSLADLRGITFKKLATTVEEEATSKTLMHELVERERGAEDERNALSATLAVQREERAKEAGALGDLEAKLRAELAMITEINAAEKLAISSESTEARSVAGLSHTSSMERLTEQLEKLLKELHETSEKHREAEVNLRKKKDKAEKELAAKVGEYDTSMTAKSSEIESLKQLLVEEKAELDGLEEHFAKVDANNAQRAEEERVLGEFRKRLVEAAALLDRAATKVQKIARGRSARAALKAATKGAKKGKKKK